MVILSRMFLLVLHVSTILKSTFLYSVVNEEVSEKCMLHAMF